MTRPTSAEPQWLPLLENVGGIAALARELGVSEMTIWRWTTGAGAISLPSRKLIVFVSEKLGVAPPVNLD